MSEELISTNLTDVTETLRLFMDADSHESAVMETQLLQLSRLEGVVNLARPFIKVYTHHVTTNPNLPACLLRLMRCVPDQDALEVSCQAVVGQYVDVMASLQAFVTRNAVWTPEIQDAFIELYEAVNRHQFATLLTLLDMCKPGAQLGCTADVTQTVQHLIHGNATVVTLSTNLMNLLQHGAAETVTSAVMKQCYEWNTKLFFYISAHVLGPLVSLASGVDWRNPDKASWYMLFYESVKGVVDRFASSELAQLFVTLFQSPSLEMKFRFSFFNPVTYAQTSKGYALYYLDYLTSWNESLTRYVQHHYVQPLMEQALTQMLGRARSMYIHERLKPVLGRLVDFVGKLYIPDVASSVSYLVVTLVLPTLLPYMAYYAKVGIAKLFKLLERQLLKYTRDMKTVLSTLPPSPVASPQRSDKKMLLFLDQMVENNRASWPYRTLKWFISLLLRDAKKTASVRPVAYECLLPQRRCMPVLEVQKGGLYYPTAQRCKQRCK